MTAILGISAFYHDSAAALVVDGHLIAAAQEERFTRKKHDASFPRKAIEYCLTQAGLSLEQLDYVAFYEKPLLKFHRLLETYLAYAPAGFQSFSHSMPLWLREKLFLSSTLRKELQGKHRKRFVFLEHHESHAASAFFCSPYDEAAILTVDGVGEWTTASIGTGRGNRIKILQELRFPHSIGMLYSAFTTFCGFKVNSGEYKLMGLAPYGAPKYVDLILDKLLDLKPDGSFRLHMEYFNFCQGVTMTSRRFETLFGGPPRRPESPLTQRELDLAASAQKVTEEILLRMAQYTRDVTGQQNLCLAGGVALNCVANGRIRRQGLFKSIWVQPSAGDAGGALGAAFFVWHQLLEQQRIPSPDDSMQGALLGPDDTNAAVQQFLDSQGAIYTLQPSEEELCRRVATELASGKVVGWFQGRMEFGPRALGNRSILGDPRRPEMQSLMNQKIKFRESFRPFAPAVLQSDAAEWFDLPAGMESPYMMFVEQVAELHLKTLDETSRNLQGLEKLQALRSDLPAVTHVDNSARVQTVDGQRNPRFHALLTAFKQQTGCPVLINTSFNVRGEPIVCTPQDAWNCFLKTHLDLLVINDFIIQRPT